MPITTGDDGAATPQTSAHLYDRMVNDPTGIAPLCGAAEFTALVEGLVADCAPRLFAVVQEYGDRVDGAIAAWGLAFDDYAEVLNLDGGPRLKVRSPEDVLDVFGRGTHIVAKVVWFNPDAASEDHN